MNPAFANYRVSLEFFGRRRLFVAAARLLSVVARSLAAGAAPGAHVADYRVAPEFFGRRRRFVAAACLLSSVARSLASGGAGGVPGATTIAIVLVETSLCTSRAASLCGLGLLWLWLLWLLWLWWMIRGLGQRMQFVWTELPACGDDLLPEVLFIQTAKPAKIQCRRGCSGTPPPSPFFSFPSCEVIHS